MPGPDTEGQLAHKRALFASRATDLLGVMPGYEDHALRTAAAISAARSGEWPTQSRQWGSASEAEPSAVRDAAIEHLGVVSTTISEDICVMSATPRGWVLTGVSVAFPSHWKPAAKLGRNLDGIHEPVPGYPRIASASRAAFDRIAAQPAEPSAPRRAIWERFNWTLVADDELCHVEPADPNPSVGESTPPGIESLWLRVERQTLTALADDLVVFLIRTFLTPLSQLDDSERWALAESLTGVSDELAEYRSWVGYREVVRRWAGGS